MQSKKTKLQFDDGFFSFRYGDCTCHDEDANVYVNWACTPDKKSVLESSGKSSHIFETYSNDLTIDFLF